MNALNSRADEPSMEEILASIRRIITEDEDRIVGAAAGVQAPAAPAEPQRSAHRHDPYAAPQPAVHFQPAPAPVEPPAYRQSPQHYATTPQPAPQPYPAAPQPAPQAYAAAPQPAPRAPEPAQTFGDGVGDAFRALEETARSRSSLTLETVVAETLRPMLREWLDIHLPGLVKDMVRDEIERITRGGR